MQFYCPDLNLLSQKPLYKLQLLLLKQMNNRHHIKKIVKLLEFYAFIQLLLMQQNCKEYTCSNLNYKPQAESRQQHLVLYMDRHLRSTAVMIEVTGRHMECTHFNLDYSQIPAVAQHLVIVVY